MILNEVNWGIIGCGNVTEFKSGPAFNKVGNSHLVAVMRRDTKKVKDYAKRHRVSKWYDNADQLLEDPEVNAIYVATPPYSHSEFAIKSMRVGKPVYVEKPMAVSYRECIIMNRVSIETGIPIFVAYYRRSLPYFKKVKELLDAQIIGEIINVDMQLFTSPRPEDTDSENPPWRLNEKIAGAGYFYDLASHQLDILDYYFGPIEQINGFMDNKGGIYEIEDTLVATCKFKNGITGTGKWCFVLPEYLNTDFIEITGNKGKISFSTFQFTPIQLQTEKQTEELLPENPDNIQYCMIKDIVEELTGNGKSPSLSNSAMRTNWVMDELLGKSTKLNTI